MPSHPQFLLLLGISHDKIYLKFRCIYFYFVILRPTEFIVILRPVTFQVSGIPDSNLNLLRGSWGGGGDLLVPASKAILYLL